MAETPVLTKAQEVLLAGGGWKANPSVERENAFRPETDGLYRTRMLKGAGRRQSIFWGGVGGGEWVLLDYEADDNGYPLAANSFDEETAATLEAAVAEADRRRDEAPERGTAAAGGSQ